MGLLELLESRSLVLIVWIIIVSSGMYYLIISHANSGKYHGTLIASDRAYVTETGGRDQDDSSWRVKEIFRKDNTNSTCSVYRLASYNTVRAVNRAKDKVILGTTRTIWSYWNDRSTCYDESIKRYYTIIGICLMIIAFIPPIMLACFSLANKNEHAIRRAIRPFSSGAGRYEANRQSEERVNEIDRMEERHAMEREQDQQRKREELEEPASSASVQAVTIELSKTDISRV